MEKWEKIQEFVLLWQKSFIYIFMIDHKLCFDKLWFKFWLYYVLWSCAILCELFKLCERVNEKNNLLRDVFYWAVQIEDIAQCLAQYMVVAITMKTIIVMVNSNTRSSTILHKFLFQSLELNGKIIFFLKLVCVQLKCGSQQEVSKSVNVGWRNASSLLLMVSFYVKKSLIVIFSWPLSTFCTLCSMEDEWLNLMGKFESRNCSCLSPPFILRGKWAGYKDRAFGLSSSMLYVRPMGSPVGAEV